MDVPPPSQQSTFETGWTRQKCGCVTAGTAVLSQGAAAAEEPLGRGPCSLDRGLRQDPEPGLNGQLLESWPRIVLSS